MAAVSVKRSITVVCFVPGEIEPCILTEFNLLNTDTFYVPFRARIEIESTFAENIRHVAGWELVSTRQQVCSFEKRRRYIVMHFNDVYCQWLFYHEHIPFPKDEESPDSFLNRLISEAMWINIGQFQWFWQLHKSLGKQLKMWPQ